MPAPNLSDALRAQLAALAAQLMGGDPRWPIRLVVIDRLGDGVRLHLEPPGVPGASPGNTSGNAPGNAPDRRPDPQHHLTPMSADCLEAADLTWRDSADLAQRAGWSYYARWRGAVGKLVKAGYLERHPTTKKLRVTEAGRARLREHRAAEAGEE